MDAWASFAFLLPTMAFAFGMAFLVIARYGSRAARLMGGGYIALGFAYFLPILAGEMRVADPTLAIDAFYLAGFFLFGQGLLVHFQRPTHRAGFALFTGASFVAVAYAVVVATSLKAELLLHDTACSLLIAVPLAFVWRRARHSVDAALLVVTGLVIFDTMVRSIVFTSFFMGEATLATFESTSYAFMMQASAGALGIVFALVALAAMGIDIIVTYRDAAEQDPLTGLLNRRGFSRVTALMEGEAERGGSMIVCDIDHFKSVNDTYGHATGDRVLVALAETMQSRLPRGALVARFGGEEFILFVPEAPEQALGLAEALRLAFEGRDWRREGVDRRLTASFGVSGARDGDRSLYDAISRADRSLYLAKAQGRNQVVLAPEAPQVPLGIVAANSA
ncbi:GGDEF domain-containing protein [Aureimonas endophytica]|uniref:diguanylate cyclase n=1 Tax=Aureimonas endophytica TaxID=2027858 RepID=A0A916ZGN5_9HYPH|nr:GGDEF domain-containing protein [Aureimonas endophytica]GGD96248.1 GGDEF domain-containing protein [Aureimonas endophytica]